MWMVQAKQTIRLPFNPLFECSHDIMAAGAPAAVYSAMPPSCSQPRRADLPTAANSERCHISITTDGPTRAHRSLLP